MKFARSGHEKRPKKFKIKEKEYEEIKQIGWTALSKVYHVFETKTEVILYLFEYYRKNLL
jgi:hypothetical protein